MTKTILVVDDTKNLRTMVQTYLTQEGFRVVTAANGQEALYAARAEKPNLIVLDLMMPEMSGMEFLNVYRREAKTPIIILTGKLEEHDKVIGLELGADDYVTKPFSLRELTARVRAVLRRAEQQEAEPEVLRVADITLDHGTRRVLVGERELNLTPTEFGLLAVFMASPGRVFSRGQLLDRLQGASFEAYERTIDLHIRNLRAKIEDDARKPRYIETVYGAGYRFAPDR